MGEIGTETTAALIEPLTVDPAPVAPPPLTAPAPPAPAAEATQLVEEGPKKISVDVLEAEKATLLRNLLGAKNVAIEKKLGQGEQLNRGENAIQQIIAIYNLNSENVPVDTRDIKHPLIVSRPASGEKFTIQEITSIEGDTLMCKVHESSLPQPFSRQEIIDAQFKSETGDILLQFSDNKAAKDFLGLAIQPAKEEDARRIIAEMANASGLITTDIAKSYLEKYKADHKDKISPTLKAAIDAVALKLQNMNLVDVSTMTDLVNLNIQELSERIIKIDDAGNDESLRYQTRIDQLRKLTEGDKSVLSLYFKKAQAGEIDPDVAKGVIEAIRAGKMDNISESILKQVGNNDNLTDEQKNAFKELFSQSGFGEESMLGGMFDMIFAVTMIVGQAVIEGNN